jgi:hypothetical protein
VIEHDLYTEIIDFSGHRDPADKASTVFTTQSSLSQDTEIQQDKTSTVFTTKSSISEDTDIQQGKASTGFTLYTEIIDFSAHRDPAG